MTFQRVQEEINWANASVLEAQAAFKAGVGKDTFAYVVEVDPQTGNKAWKIKRVGNTPPEIRICCEEPCLTLSIPLTECLMLLPRQAIASLSTRTTLGLRQSLDLKEYSSPDKVSPVLDSLKILSANSEDKSHTRDPGPPSRQNIVREIAQMANDKHSIGIIVGAHAMMVSAKIAIAFDVTRCMNTWDFVNDELIVLEVGPDAADLTTAPDVNVTIDVFFERGDQFFEVSAFRALRIF
ncbi:hypothetical protein ACFQGS_23100, partial [Novosphingobium lubricantis]